jgi:Na+/H+ antiporter NhaD/arsenite permease-like protein
MSAAVGLFGAGAAHSDKTAVADLLLHHANYVRAISVGSVFFGAVTYIGNGPNFLVKSIADQAKAHTPGFFGYFFKYSVPVLMPVFFVIWAVFFRS